MLKHVKHAHKINPPANAFALSKMSLPRTLFFSPTEIGEIAATIRSIKNLKTLLSYEVAQLIVIITNKMFCSGNLLNVLKMTEVTPLFKTGDRRTMSNYRPFSIISNLAKIIENVIKCK